MTRELQCRNPFNMYTHYFWCQEPMTDNDRLHLCPACVARARVMEASYYFPLGVIKSKSEKRDYIKAGPDTL